MVKPRFFYGWYIVLYGFLGHSMRVGLGLQTFGFFFKPMSEELGWSRSLLTGALMTRDLIEVVIAPIVGFAVDKYGPRFMMAGSAIILGITLMLLSQTHSLWQFVLFFSVIGAFGVPGLGYGVISPTLAKWFIRKRGRATGIATSGLNVGAVVMTPIILVLISQYGWRGAWLALGFIPWIVVVPPALIWLRRQPEDIGLLPDGDSNEPSVSTDPGSEQQPPASEPIVDEVSWTPREAFRTPALWLVLSYNVMSPLAWQ